MKWCCWVGVLTTFCTFAATTKDDEYKRNGGEYANPKGPFRHSARIFEDLDLICSAIIIGPRLILTVAHCVDSYTSFESSSSANYSRLSIVTGMSNAEIKTTEVEDIRILSEYLPRGTQPALGDVALLKSKSRLFDEGLKPIFWPSQDHFVDQLNNPNCDLYSWGAITRDRETFPDKLKRMLMHRVGHCSDIVDYCEECDSVSPEEENMLCGSVERSRGFICDGDVGGPIVHHDKDKVTLIGLLIGEVLEEQSCGKEQFAVVSFVNIFHWKKQITKLAESLQTEDADDENNVKEKTIVPSISHGLKSIAHHSSSNSFSLYQLVFIVVVASVVVTILALCIVVCSVYKKARLYGKLLFGKILGVMMLMGRRPHNGSEFQSFL